MNLAEKYIDDVLNGNIVAGKRIIQAVQRHLDDLEKADEKGIYFDADEAELFIDSAELFPFAKGKKAGQPFDLQGWQAFLLYCVYGWKLKETDTRRFNKAYVKIARKGGKTELLAMIGNMGLTIDKVNGGEVYWAATKKEQARIGWKRQKMMMDRMITKSDYLKKQFKTNQVRIFSHIDDKFAAYLGKDSHTEDGLSPYYGIIDEYHAHNDDSMVNILESGNVGYEEPIIWIITTAGYNLQSACKNFEDRCVDILDGKIENDDVFCLIFDLDEGDNWEDERVWEKSNPGLGVSPTVRGLKSALKKAKMEGPSKVASFKVKNLNIWLNQEQTWIDDNQWMKCGNDFTKESLFGRECFGGLDLANTRDLNAFCLWFPPIEDEKHKLLWFYWLNQEEAELKSNSTPKIPYLDWAEQGWIHLSPGNVSDHSFIIEAITELHDQYDIQAIGYDRRFALQVVLGLQENGIELQPYSQSWDSISAPTQEYERLIMQGNIEHNNDPIARWGMGNVAIKYNGDGATRIDKSKSKNKVDMHVAAAMANGMRMKGEIPPENSIWDNDDFMNETPNE